MLYPPRGAIASKSSFESSAVHLDSDHSPDHIHSCGLFDYRDGVAVPEARMTLEGAPKRNPSPVWRLLRYETRPV